MRGIYAITNILTDTVYYGQSIVMAHRLSSHRWALNKNKHGNLHLQRSWNKYGKDAFIFTTIKIIEDKKVELTSIEKKYKDNAYNLGLNIFNIADPEKPLEPSLELRKRRSERMKGNKNLLGINILMKQ